MQFFTGGDLYKRYIQERTLKQVSKGRDEKGASEADRRKMVDMLLKSTVLDERQLQELQVVSTLLSQNIDEGDKLKYLLEDSFGERHGTFLLWFPPEHPLYFSIYLVRGEGP